MKKADQMNVDCSMDWRNGQRNERANVIEWRKGEKRKRVNHETKKMRTELVTKTSKIVSENEYGKQSVDNK